MLFQGGFSFSNFLTDGFAVFLFVVWFWLLITVAGDLFRRRDVSGLGKALWVLALILAPYVGLFVYMIFEGRSMAERSNQQSQQARDELRRVVGFSVADEIVKLDGLRKSGSITAEELAHRGAKRVDERWRNLGLRRCED